MLKIKKNWFVPNWIQRMFAFLNVGPFSRNCFSLIMCLLPAPPCNINASEAKTRFLLAVTRPFGEVLGANDCGEPHGDVLETTRPPGHGH